MLINDSKAEYPETLLDIEFEDGESPLQNNPFDKNTNDFFCLEDTFLAKDVKVCITGESELKFPLAEADIFNLINLCKAQNVEEAWTIPVDKINIEIKEELLSHVITRIEQELSINQNFKLVPQLYNMLIYGPGQFLKTQKNSEKIENMAATLVIALPSPHIGGDLIIELNKKKHKFFGSSNPEIVKCIAFFSECNHEVKKVEQGYRVVLTYNLQLHYSEIFPTMIPIDEGWKNSLAQFFGRNEIFVYFFDHVYTERNLKWNMLKAMDSTFTHSLLAIAKQANYASYLAMADRHEICDANHDLTYIAVETKLEFLIDLDNNILELQKKIGVHENEIFYKVETKGTFQPYRTEETIWVKNKKNTIEHWYKRACIVLQSTVDLSLNSSTKNFV